MKPGEAIGANEFALVSACLRWPQQAGDGELIRRLAQTPIHWTHLLNIVYHHKVLPLVARNLDAFARDLMPETVAATLRAGNIENAHTCLRRVAHLRTLMDLFREQDLDVRVLKGIPLAMVAFHDPTLREAGDIDLLIATRDIFSAGDLLRAQGYIRFEPQARLTPRRLHSYLAHQKDFSYTHPTAGIVIDLHWRLFRNQWLPTNAGIDEVGEQWLELSTAAIPIVPTPRLLLYLCAHGALDGWLRLKWLADIRALLHTMSPQSVEETAAAAAEQQALPAFSAALLLCEELLGPLPNPLPDGCLPRDHTDVAHLLTFSRECITSNHYCPVREKIPSTQWFLNEFRLHHSLRYRLDLFARSLFRPRVWASLPLPDWLFPLYALLSLPEWVYYHLHQRWLARKQARLVRSPRMRRARRALRGLSHRRPADIALAIEAACMLSFYRLALHFMPVGKLVAWMQGPHTTSEPGAAQQTFTHGPILRTLRRIEWSIAAVVRHAPLTFVCFPQCLAAYFMLRRRNIASTLVYGVTRDEGQLKAHTWVKVGDRTIVGGEVAGNFTVLTTFP